LFLLREIATTWVVALKTVQKRITDCEACPRLRKHCLKIAQIKRRAYKDEVYWGKPVAGFGDPRAQLLVVGLAPAAHGANRTGRVFTGDRSGEWLYRALHRTGFANQPESVSRDDGLKLRNAYITSVVRCAPPDNKPTPAELERCASHLDAELREFARARVFLVLGQIALAGLWPHLLRMGVASGSRPKFGHGAKLKLSSGQWLLMSYHPSQQNTFTGRLTEPMFDSVFAAAKNLV
jgi:uracil-DNA glycosylase